MEATKLPLSTWFLAIYLKLTPVAGFTFQAPKAWSCLHLAPGGYVASDGLACFKAVTPAGCVREPTVGGGRKSKELPEFQWINTVLGNLKTRLRGNYHAFRFAKYATRYLGAFAYRSNRRFNLATLAEQLLIAVVHCGPRTEPALRGAELSC